MSTTCLCPRNSSKVDENTCSINSSLDDLSDDILAKGKEEKANDFTSSMIIGISASSLLILIISISVVVSFSRNPLSIIIIIELLITRFHCIWFEENLAPGMRKKKNRTQQKLQLRQRWVKQKREKKYFDKS